MNEQQTWAEALNISPEMIEQWSTEVPEGLPLLVWCLQEGHIHAADYLAWARERFALPVLSSAFFESAAFDPTYLKSQSQDSQWHPWCYPISQWENITYVACVEPPREDWAPNTCYVLADPRVLREAWEAESFEPAQPTDVLAPPVPPPVDDAPIGMDISIQAKPFKLSLGDEGDLLSGNAFAAVDEVVSEEEAQEAKSNTFIMEDAVEASVPETRSEPAVLESEVMPQAAEPEPAPVPAPVAKIVPAAKKVEVMSAHTSTDNEKDILGECFQMVTQSFSSVAVFKMVEGVAVFQYGDKSLQIPKGKKPKLDLNYPSFLRVVLRTEHPYHGYLVDTPTHHEFFSDMGLNMLPACVTAVPLKINGQIWGMMIALGEEKNRPNTNIAIVEKAAAQLIELLGPMWANAA